MNNNYSFQLSSAFKLDVYSIAALAVVVAVVIFKIPHLPLPFFWDEAWVYGPAVKLMAENGPSLLPNAIPVEYTRGHPLVFHFLNAVWIKIFGGSMTAIHSFPLFVAALLLLATFVLGRLVFNGMVALTIMVLLAVQPIFLAQASLSLPEVLMALWSVLVVIAYLTRRKWALLIFASLMLLTKESGIVLIGTLMFWEVFEHVFLKKESWMNINLLKRLALLFTPIIIASSYFILQKLVHGWFLYPEHLGMLKLGFPEFYGQFMNCFILITEGQGKYLLWIVFFTAIALFRKRLNWNHRILFVVAVVVGFSFLETYYNLESYLYFDVKITPFLILLLFAFLFHFIFNPIYRGNKDWGAALIISSLFTFFYLIFTSVNFMSLRYLMVIYPFLLMALVGVSWHAMENKKLWFAVFMILAIANIARQIPKANQVNDVNLGYVDGVKVHQQLVDYLGKNVSIEAQIFTEFPTKVSLTDTLAGYVEPGHTYVVTDLSDETDYCIFTNFELLMDRDSLKNVLSLEPMSTIQSGKAQLEVFKFQGWKNPAETSPVELPEKIPQ